MSSVVRTSLPTAFLASRTDGAGRPISLDQRQPDKNTLVFTGAPGMGKSVELDRAEALARSNNWICIRVDVPTTEPLEMRFARAVKQELPALQKRFGIVPLLGLKKTVKDLTPRRAQQKGFEGRLNLGVTTWVWKTQWDARGTITSTLSQLADNLAELAAREKDTYVLLMVDNLPVPPPGGRSLSDEEMAAAHNLNGLAELTDHLHDNGRHVYLIAAGAESAAAGLMERVEGGMGIGSAARSKFDLRDCAPLTPDELRPAVTDELDHSGVRYDPDAVEHLVKAANGSPARMRDLLDTALQNSPAELTPAAAKLATASVKAESAIVYEKAWSSCSNAEMDLLTRAAAQGPQGLTTPAPASGGSEKWQALERARTTLVTRGILRETDGRITVADPGLQEWVNARVGQSMANAGVAPPGNPALNQSGSPTLGQSATGTGRHRQTAQTTTRREGDPSVSR